MRVIILGGGISGLSLAWFLHRHCELLLLEKESQLGGWLQTECANDFLFDRGPRTFRFRPESALMQLIRELHLEKEMIFSSAKKRYLLREGRLQTIPYFKLLLSLFKEWRVPYYAEEESIAAFAKRRFSQEIAETIFDAMALGVYGGDMHELSLEACFPKIKEWEKRYGSLTHALLSHLASLKKGGLISFKQGSATLIHSLANQLGSCIKLSQKVEQIQCDAQGVTLLSNETLYHADYLISALPALSLKKLFPKLDLVLSPLKMKSLQIVHCGFKERVFPTKGFGYLVPTKEGGDILGATFDSAIFPEQNRREKETRITFMVKSGSDAVSHVHDALNRHLQISASPDYLNLTQAKEAIPQFNIGHKALISRLQEEVKYHYPRLYLTGNYLSGVSVADCIATSKDLSESLLHTHNRHFA